MTSGDEDSPDFPQTIKMRISLCSNFVIQHINSIEINRLDIG
jgi:hypothetical protein